ncbi:MAG: pilin [Patescibacteria group bacterium]|jgi:hypothetical protein
MKRLLRFALPVLFTILPFAASAQIRLLPPCTATGDCGITDILAVFVNAAEYLIGITGAVALLFFVYGGFTFILAAGDKTKVGKAIGILKSAVTGIAIIFFAGVLVRFTTQALTGGTSKIPVVGENCKVDATATNGGVSDRYGNGLWISVPPGLDANGKLIPETLRCIPTQKGCEALVKELEKRNRLEKYSCKPIEDGLSCVRGLCTDPGQGANIACCL